MKVSAVVYGRVPMMITANCLKKTMERCNMTPEIMILTDRYEKQFPVYTDCRSCYNVIYNSVPLSLHELFDGRFSAGAAGRKPAGQHPGSSVCFCDNFRLDFTVEDGEDTLKTILYFQDLLDNYREPFYKEYTTGHYKRGVE